MKVLVVDSLRHVHPTQKAERTRFAAACREMGKAFAEKGHTFIVGTDDPEQPHALSEADVLVLVGGRTTAGADRHSAATVGLPSPAVPSFDGAVVEVWSKVRLSYREGGVSKEDERTLQAPWSQGSAAIVVKCAESLARNAIHAQGYGVHVGLFLATLILAASWVALFQPQTVGWA